MNTPTHLLIAASLFANRRESTLVFAAVAGALVPDLSLYLLAGFSLFIQGNEADYVFGTQYYSNAWQRIFSIDNSFLVWGVLLTIAIVKRWHLLIAFSIGGFAHLLCDFPLHHDDGRAHFWPVSDWVFKSPLSYWDVNHHAKIIAPMEAVLALGLAVYLMCKLNTVRARCIFGVVVVVPVLFILFSWLTFAS